jgi:hypothetical protein
MAPISIAATIIGLRPMRSDSTLLNNNEMASAAVDTDSDRLLWAGVSTN